MGSTCGCNELDYCAVPTETHEVRCCSDTQITGWAQRNTDCPWTESDRFSSTAMDCIHGMTFGQADEFCTSVGARLCTANEVARECTRGTGCGHDNDLVWTSDAGTWNPANVGLALAAEASGSNTWDPSTTTTEAPEDGTVQPQSSTASPGAGTDDAALLSAAGSGDDSGDDSNAGVVVGVVVGLLLVIAIVVAAVVYGRHRRREVGTQQRDPTVRNPTSDHPGQHMRATAQNLTHDAELVAESETDVDGQTDGQTGGRVSPAERQKAMNRNSMC